MPTTYLKGPEAIERAIAATLTTYLPGELDAVWAAWAATDTADGLVVPNVHPAQIVAGRLAQITDYPTVMVASDSGRMTSVGAPNWGEVDHTIAIISWLVGDDIHTLDKMTKRYLQAIWEVIMKHQSLDGSMGFTGIDPIDYGRGVPVKLDLLPGLEQMAGWTVVVHTADTTSQ